MNHIGAVLNRISETYNFNDETLGSEETEKRVIGYVLQGLDRFHAFTKLKPYHFFTGDFKAVWSELESGLSSEMQLIRAVANRLNLGEYEVSRRFRDWSSYTMHQNDIENYQKIITDGYERRALIVLLDQTVTQLKNSSLEGMEKTKQTIAEFQNKLANIESKINFEDTETTTESILLEYEQELTEFEQNGFRHAKEPDHMPFGLGSLDHEIQEGLQRGVVTVIGAGTSMGKTALMAKMFYECAKRGNMSFFYTLEDQGRKVFDRVLAVHSGVYFRNTNKRKWSGSNHKYLSKGIAELKKTKELQVRAPKTRDLAQLKRLIRLHTKKHKAKVFFLDYIQKIQVKGTRGDYDRITAAMYDLQELANELNVAIVVGSQMNRGKEEDSKTGNISYLKGSGAIEEAAHVVLTITRDKNEVYEDENFRRFSPAEIFIAKNKDGGCRRLGVIFDCDLVTFRDYERKDTQVKGLNKAL